MKVTLILFFLIISLGSSFGQDLKFGNTTTTSHQPTNKLEKVKKKRLLSWIIDDPKNNLIGNKCYEEYTNRLGFQYVLQTRGHAIYKGDFTKMCHNAGVKFILTLKNGPFWRFKLKKYRKQCQNDTGDFMG